MPSDVVPSNVLGHTRSHNSKTSRRMQPAFEHWHNNLHKQQHSERANHGLDAQTLLIIPFVDRQNLDYQDGPQVIGKQPLGHR